MSGYVGPVSQDMQVQTRTDTTPKVRLRQERYEAWSRLLGLNTDTARAEFFGYDERTIRRARAGRLGANFIARTVFGFRTRLADLAPYGIDPALDELFTVEAA